MNDKPTTRFRSLIAGSNCVVAPGVADALAARLVALEGFEAVYMTGFGTSLTRLASPEILFFAGCALIGELVPLKVVTRGVEGEVTTSTTFAFAAMLVAGPACAFVALVGASFAADAMRGKAPTKLLFNSSQYAITITAAAVALHFLTGVPRVGSEFHFAPEDLPGILAAASVFFVVNSVLVATVIALVQQLRIGRYLV